jgi:hypothetical protein
MLRSLLISFSWAGVGKTKAKSKSKGLKTRHYKMTEDAIQAEAAWARNSWALARRY